MEPPIRVAVDKDALIEAAFAYVTGPWPRSEAVKQHLQAVQAVGTALPTVFLDAMVLDGVRDREDVAELVSFCLRGWDDLSQQPVAEPVAG